MVCICDRVRVCIGDNVCICDMVIWIGVRICDSDGVRICDVSSYGVCICD